MVKERLQTQRDVEDFIRGVTFFGTGGGGRPEDGQAHLERCLAEGIDLGWVDVNELSNEAWGCTVFGMGSIAPKGEEEDDFGLVKKVVPRPMVAAINELAEYAQVKIEIVTAFELGGSNTPKAMDAGLRVGALIPDGDFCGRAVPELSQTTAALAGISAAPVAICDDWGNKLIVKSTATVAAAEGIGKMISIVTKAPDIKATCAHAAFLMQGKEIKKLIVPNTLSKSLNVGKVIREAREKGDDPVLAAAVAAQGKCIFRGEVSNVKWVSQEGYMIGTTTISGSDDYGVEQLEIWFKNENHLVTYNGKPLVMSPDLIHVVEADTAEPITNSKMEQGLKVAVIASPNYRYRTAEAIAALGPRHFGYDFAYKPFAVK
jgi:DUF917 family protein